MGRTRWDVDGAPVGATCDLCGHPHACFVGGRPTYDASGEVEQWERRVCLGCLMRAATADGFESSADCRLISSPTLEGQPRHA